MGHSSIWYTQSTREWSFSCCERTNLSINELDDVGVAAQTLQQRDFVNEASGCLAVTPGQPYALQRIDQTIPDTSLLHWRPSLQH